MKYNEAVACLGVLVGATSGWTDDRVGVYAERIKTWPDARAVREACQLVADTWTGYRTPPLGVIREAYLGVMRRKSMEAGSNVYALPTSAVIHVSEGRVVAANGYVEECRRQGREPNWPFFDKLIGKIDAG